MRHVPPLVPPVGFVAALTPLVRCLAALGLVVSAFACATHNAGDIDARASRPAETAVFDEPVAVFLLADSAAEDSLRAEYSEDDYAVVADDRMWYRAEAWNWLEQNGIRTVHFEGRPALSFVVHGVATAYDFGAEPTLDLVVLYRPGREPIALAPIEVAERATAYFSGP